MLYVRLADYAGPSYPYPSRPAAVYVCTMEITLSHLLKTSVRHCFSCCLSCFACKNLVAVPVGDASTWRVPAARALRFGPLLGLEIQVEHATPITRCSNLLTLFSPLYQRAVVSQPPILPLSLFITIWYTPLPYASRHHFCRLRDTPGCCQRCQCPQGVSLRRYRLRR